MTCNRPYCSDPANAYIPLPEGSRLTKVLLCHHHEQEARAACYYVCPLDGYESEEGFYKAVRAKHKLVRGSDRLREFSGMTTHLHRKT